MSAQRQSEGPANDKSSSGSDKVSLRSCEHCGRAPGPEEKDHQLRRCAGCLVALFCSKECQKAAWNLYHRDKCREIANAKATPEGMRASVAAQSIGYANLDSYGIALHEFIRAHTNAFVELSQLSVLERGGASWAKDNLLHFFLTPTPSLGSHRNPARAFKFEERQFVAIRDYFAFHPSARAYFAEFEPMRERVLEAYRRIYPTFKCLIMVRIGVMSVDASELRFFPYCEPADPLRDRSMSRLYKAALISDMFELITGGINLGFPLRDVHVVCPGGNGRHTVTVPGRFTRANGSWIWEAFFTDWDDYRRGVHKGLDDTIGRFITGLRPDELMSMFDEL